MIDIRMVEKDNSQLPAYGYKIISGLQESIYKKKKKRIEKKKISFRSTIEIG